MNLTLFALFLTSFGIGTTEYVGIGILPNIAHGLHISIAKAGLLLSYYALGVTVGSPCIVILTNRLSRHTAMMILIGIFILGNFLSAIAPNYSSLVVARILASLCHGAFFGLGAVIATNVVSSKRRASAIAMMVAGLTVANIVGVPLGTALGQWMGWRSTFGLITIIGLFAALAMFLWIPRNLQLQSKNLFSDFGVLRKAQVWLAMLMSVLSSASLFTVLTYLTPMLEKVTGISPHFVMIYLILFGVGITIGNLLGGKLADWKLMQSLIGIFISLILILMLMSITIYYFYLSALTIFLWGILSFGLISPLQMRVVQEAKGAPNFASTINQSAFHLGNCLGALISSILVSLHIGYQHLMWAGVLLALTALIVNIYSYKTEENLQDDSLLLEDLPNS